MRIRKNFLCLLMTFLIANVAMVSLVNAEDEIDDTDENNKDDSTANVEEENVDEEKGPVSTVSPDADIFLLFTKPSQDLSNVELPAGSIVEFLVGFINKGKEDFVIETLDASFRHPIDFNFHFQNFSAVSYRKTVKPGHESTIAYSFMPADAFAGRPIGLNINLSYRDKSENFYFDAVFNETIHIVDSNEGLDTEVFFMYVSLIAMVMLAFFLCYTLLSGKSKGTKRSGGAAAKIMETGTIGDEIDYEWIPRSALRTPGSRKTSPRNRKKATNATSSDEE